MFAAVKKFIVVFLVGALVLISSHRTAAAFDYEFYFFGINLKTFQNGNWPMLAAGALTSILCHELGHALYLDSQGKDWNIIQSQSGLTIETDNDLTNSQYQNFGWSGFAFQSFLGTILTSFDITRQSDFTKGFVSVTAAQLLSYEHRGHDNGDDFALIERGNGDKDPNFGMLAVINHNNLVAIANLEIDRVSRLNASPGFDFRLDIRENPDSARLAYDNLCFRPPLNISTAWMIQNQQQMKASRRYLPEKPLYCLSK